MWLVHLWWMISSTTNAFYGNFSGWVGDVTIAASAGTGLIMLWKKLNCHVDERPNGGKNCHKIGLHHVANGKYIVCKHHHPDMGPDHVITAKVVAQAHQKNQGHG